MKSKDHRPAAQLARLKIALGTVIHVEETTVQQEMLQSTLYATNNMCEVKYH